MNLINFYCSSFQELQESIGSKYSTELSDFCASNLLEIISADFIFSLILYFQNVTVRKIFITRNICNEKMENTLVFLMYCGIFHETIKQEALITDKD